MIRRYPPGVPSIGSIRYRCAAMTMHASVRERPEMCAEPVHAWRIDESAPGLFLRLTALEALFPACKALFLGKPPLIVCRVRLGGHREDGRLDSPSRQRERVARQRAQLSPRRIAARRGRR